MQRQNLKPETVCVYGVEVSKSGILCDYISKGNTVVMLAEFHGKKAITNSEELKELTAGTKKRLAKLKSCGVRFENLDPSWA